MRPGAGYLPTLALGRPRGFTTEPACAVPGVAMVGSAAGASPVTLLRSTPRQAYRIYSEEEFLAAEDWQVEAEPEFALLGHAGPRREPKRWGGLAALAALTSVVAAVVGVAALNATRSKPQSNRRIATRGGSPPEIVADRPSIRRLDTPPRKHIRRASAVVRRVPEHRPLPVGRPLSSERPYLPPEPSSPAPTSTPASASTPVSVKATAPTATMATTPAGGADAEFGFERR
jgi:hypothetical protein